MFFNAADIAVFIDSIIFNQKECCFWVLSTPVGVAPDDKSCKLARYIISVNYAFFTQQTLIMNPYNLLLRSFDMYFYGTYIHMMT